jgi:hypothetical protein
VLYAITAVAQRPWPNDSAGSDASLSRLDVLFVDGTFGRRVYFTATWVLAIGLPLVVAVVVHLRRSTRLAMGSSTA